MCSRSDEFVSVKRKTWLMTTHVFHILQTPIIVVKSYVNIRLKRHPIRWIIDDLRDVLNDCDR